MPSKKSTTKTADKTAAKAGAKEVATKSTKSAPAEETKTPRERLSPEETFLRDVARIQEWSQKNYAKAATKLVNHAGKKRKRAKKEKDKNAPPKPLSAYFTFQKEVMPQVKEENPELTKVPDRAKKVAEKWRDLTDEQRATYKEAATEAKAAWQVKMDDYTKTKEASKGGEEGEGDETEEDDAPPAPKKRAKK